ncbi:AfsR/SARP family transcriptional regulator [Streptomyces aureus]
MLRNETANEPSLELLGDFGLVCSGQRVRMPIGVQRLLAFLALQSDGIHRGAVAQQIWPDYPCPRAAANLRSALCQGRRASYVPLVDCIGQRLRLSPLVRVDLHTVSVEARKVVDGLDPPSDTEALINDLTRELLPAWSDEWLELDRERWNQLRVYALEGVAQRMLAAGRYLPALQAAIAAIAIDPIRETAHRIVVEVHLAEGNVASAVRCYQHYCDFLLRELRVNPSPQMTGLLQGLLST